MPTIHVHLHRHVTRDNGFEESKHPRANNGQFGAGAGKHTNTLAQKQAERRAAALANARSAQKNDAKAKAAAFEALKSHPNYSEADFTYLKEKGYDPDEIRAIWDRDRKAGHGPQLGNKNSAENKHHMQQIGKAMGLGRK